jgi:DNA adenine methylase
VSKTAVRPALRYYGGKWRTAPWILSHFPPHKCYVEPFGGAASVLIQKERSQIEVYNDLNSDVVSYFRVLREQSEALTRAVHLTPYAREEYDIATSDEEVADPVERARRFCVRSWQSQFFKLRSKSGWRVINNDSRSQSPAADWANMTHLNAIADRFRKVQIEHGPAIDVIKRYDTPETLFYVDPPYVLDTRVDRSVYVHEMTDDDHAALAKVLHAVKGSVVLSGYRSDLYESLYGDWWSADTTSRINSPNGAKLATETIWTNAEAQRRLNSQGLFAIEAIP